MTPVSETRLWYLADNTVQMLISRSNNIVSIDIDHTLMDSAKSDTVAGNRVRVEQEVQDGKIKFYYQFSLASSITGGRREISVGDVNATSYLHIDIEPLSPFLDDQDKLTLRVVHVIKIPQKFLRAAINSGKTAYNLSISHAGATIKTNLFVTFSLAEHAPTQTLITKYFSPL